MKPTKLFLTLLISFTFQNLFCDIIPDNSHYVEKCVKITNLTDYPDISLIGYIYGVMPSDNYIIDSTCLSKGYKFNSFDIYAVEKDYLTNKDVTEINWAEDKYSVKSNIEIEPYAGYYNDLIPIDKIEEFYKILGFTDNSIVIFKWKEVFGFNNGSTDSTITYEYTGDITTLNQNLTTGIKENSKFESNIILYPNPANKFMIAKISNSYIGLINMQLISADGKIVSTRKIIKNSELISTELSTSKLTNGIYVLKLQFDETVETKQIVIK